MLSVEFSFRHEKICREREAQEKLIAKELMFL